MPNNTFDFADTYQAEMRKIEESSFTLAKNRPELSAFDQNTITITIDASKST